MNLEKEYRKGYEAWGEAFEKMKKTCNLILNGEWVVNLKGNQEKPMKCEYGKELKDLKQVYESTLEEIKPRFSHKLEGLVHYMKEFIQMYEAKKELHHKLQRLNAKLECEDEDEGCCDEEDEDDDE